MGKIKELLEGFRQSHELTKGSYLLVWLGIIVILLLSIIVMIMPRIQKQRHIKEQNEMIELILEGEDSIEVETASNDAVFDFYGEDTDSLDFFGDATQNQQQEVIIEEIDNKKPKKTELSGLGIIEIDKINLKIPVADGATKTSLKVAAGHVKETAQIGSTGNAVVAAHRSYTKGQFFNRLDELVIGDMVTYTVKDGANYKFKVVDILTLEPSDSKFFDIRIGKSDLTLYTCTPVKIASHRLAIRCELVETISNN